MDYYGILYGFNVPVAALGFVAACSAIIAAVKTGQHRWQYMLIFLGGVFCLAKKLLFILLVSGTVFQSASRSQIIASTMAYTFFDQMFIPLVYCVFFRTCHTAIIANQPMVGNERSKKGLGARLFSAYIAYAWLLALIGTNAAFCALYDISTTGYGVVQLRTMANLAYVNIFGVWLFALLALLQILFAYQALRAYLKSLFFYLCTPLIGSAGITALYFLPDSATSLSLTPLIISFVVVEMIGLFGLLFALWALSRYWPAEDKKPLIINQPNYIYVPPVTGQQGGLYSYSPATGSSPEISYQVPPVIQIPQPQHQQAGQYPIVQIPIDQSGQQHGQYSSYRSDDIHQRYHFT